MKLANIISIIGHPMFMPLYAIIILFQFNPYVSQSLNENAEQLLLNVELMDLVTYSEEAIGEKNKQVIDLGIQEHLNDKN